MSVSKGQPGVLILDNHSSHITLETIELAIDHGLSLVMLPPHCNHKLQPLDVGVLGAFKRFYSSTCDDWHLSNPDETITIYYVVKLPGKALAKSFTMAKFSLKTNFCHLPSLINKMLLMIQSKWMTGET